MSTPSSRPERTGFSGPADPVLTAIGDWLQQHSIRDAGLIVAVSGGADSVALLVAIKQLAPRFGLQPHAAHFDHRLRPDSAADADWVRALCESLSIPLVIGQPDSTPPATHIENWARNQRYEFLIRAAGESSARWVAVAHHANDQAETVLHHILRGTGLTGLGGIPETRTLSPDVVLIRPCLNLTREQLTQWLTQTGIEYRTDPSNDDRRFTRNLIRHDLIPTIEQSLNRGITSSLTRLSAQARDVSRLIQRSARKRLQSALLEQTATTIRLDPARLAHTPLPVLREVAVQIWRQMNWPRREMTFAHWERAARLMKGRGPAGVDWPGQVRGRRRSRVITFEQILPSDPVSDQQGTDPETPGPDVC